MTDMTLRGTYVTICDWQGRIVWTSGDDLPTKPGDLAWQNLAPACREHAKLAIARVVSLQEEVTLELCNMNGNNFRAWLWPLGSPELAVCVLSVAVPKELSRITARERDVLSLLAQGRSAREIGDELDISVSTVHTHLRRAKKKLNLPSLDALTGFAARYCHPHATPVIHVES